MADKVTFAPMPPRAGGDDRLHALDLRALLVIAFHDRMSMVRGKGGGCYAKHQTLAAELGVDIARFSKSLARLADFGYVLIEKQEGDRRRKTVRVIYSQNGCHGRQQSQPDDAPEIVATEDNYRGEMVATADNETGEIVDICDFQTRRNLPKTDAQYIPLRGEIDFEESSEIDSIEMARLDDACGVEDFSKLVANAVSSIGQGHREPELPASGINLFDLLPKSWPKLEIEARLSHFERALVRLDWDTSRLRPDQATGLRNALTAVMDMDFSGGPIGQRAERMLCRLDLAEAAE